MFHLLFLLLKLICMAGAVTSQPILLYEDCIDNGNYTDDSIYYENLKTLTSMYSDTQISYGFYKFAAGEDPDRVYGVALCRPDISPDLCRTCIKEVSDFLLAVCPNYKESVGGQDDCLFLYTFQPDFRLSNMGPYFWVYSLNNVSDVADINLSRSTFLYRLGIQAGAGDSRYKYAIGQIETPESDVNIY
ncbi:Cysteine-rich receptor-like protein kinase 8 [Euphorbia peplus]|nr:Cysteine-rich receptor-like protein kinase 8 [Euphorbia peplus]